MRRCYRWNPESSRMEEVFSQRQERLTPDVHFDLPGYVSPVTGKWVEGRRARSEDLKRSGSRPYEGREQEQKEIARQEAYADQQRDKRMERDVADVWSHSPERIRRELK